MDEKELKETLEVHTASIQGMLDNQLLLAAGARSGGFSAEGGAVTKLKMLEIEGARLGGEPGLFDS